MGTSGYTDYTYKEQRWYAKVDWYITDNHLLEATSAGDKYKTEGTNYGYDYVNLAKGAFFSDESSVKSGPTLLTGKYTGYFGDNVTVTALYGKMKTPIDTTLIGYDAGNGPVIGGTTSENPAYTGGTPIEGAQKISSVPADGQKYEKTNLRLNLEWRLGDHTLNAGVDNQEL